MDSSNYLLSLLYHPDWHDQVIAIEGAEMICHAEDSAGAELKGRLVDHAKDSGQALVRQGGLLDLQGAELPVALQDDVDLLGVPITVEI